MGKPQAIVFWDANSWHWIDVTDTVCDNVPHEKLHDTIMDAIGFGYEILGFRNTRGSFQVGHKYATKA